MSQRVPSSWRQAEIGIICDLINGRAFKPKEWSSAGLPIIRIQNLNNPKAKYNYYDGELADKHRIESGDLLFAWSGTPGTSFGAHVWSGPSAALNQHIFKIVFNESFIDKRFLRYAINQTLDELISGAHGGVGLRHVTKGKFESTEVALPSSAEQKVIADKLDTLLAQVEATKARLERIPKILKRFRQSVLSSAMSGRLTEEWRKSRTINSSKEDLLSYLEELRYAAIQDENLRTGKKVRYKKLSIDTSGAPGNLPGSWSWIPVEALAAKVTDGVHKKPTYVRSGVPFITVKNLTKGNGISFSETNFISENDHEEFCKRTNPERGDILISKDGTLGVVRQIRTDIIFSIFVSVALVKPVDRRMSDYLEIAFQSPLVQGQMIGVGTGLQHIHLTDLRKDLIPVPLIDEQEEIVRRVDLLFNHADRIEQQVNRAVDRVKSLTQSILAKTFRGELTEQWRKDNPGLISGENSAEVLLRKIQAKREFMAPKRKVRKKTQ